MNHRIVIAAAVLLLAANVAIAQTWDGGGLNDNFNTANNWNPNGVPANNGTANLIFDGIVRPSPDVNVNFNVNGITFAPGATPFTLQRANNAILTVQAGGITNNSALTQTFEVPVNFGATSTISAANNGLLTFRGNIGLGASAVTVTGTGTGDVSFSNFLGITGTGSLTKNGDADFNISSDGSEQNYDLILNSGTVNYTGSGPIFGNNASIQLNGGTMTVASILTLTLREGATFTRTAPATVTLGAGMSIESDADATFQGNYSTAPSAIYRVIGTGSTLTATEFLVANDARLEVNTAAVATIQTRFQVGSITDGTVVVDGGTLNANTVTFTPTVGTSGGTGILAVRNAGSVDLSSRTFTVGSAGTGTLFIERGGDLVAGQLLVGIGGSGGGTVTVTGVGSTLRTSQTSTSEIGMASGTTATVNLEDGGELNLIGGLNIRATGTLNINGGMLTMAPARRINNEGVLNFQSGKIVMGESLGVGGANSLLGVNLALTTGREVDVSVGALTVAPPGSLVIDGGVVRAGQLVNQGGTVDFRRGTLALTGPSTLNINSTGPLGANVSIGPGARLEVMNAPTFLDATASLVVDGGTFLTRSLANNGSLLIGGGSAQIMEPSTNATGAQLVVGKNLSLGGALLNAVGGRIELAGGAARIGGAGVIQNSGLITGSGTVTAPINNNATGEIRADVGNTLNVMGVSGNNAGTLNLRGGQIDFAQALTNSATGQINGRGALSFAGGLLNQGKMQFSGGPTDIHGAVNFVGGGEMINSGGANVVTFYGNVTHNGDEIRTSPTNTTVFFGNVTGAGPFTGTGAVRFEGTFTPGNSPAAVPVEGDLNLGADSRLVMELSGTTAGAQYDQLHVGGLLSLGGALQVNLLDGFAPRYGDTFDLFDFGSLTGRFDDMQLPPLPGRLVWDTTALYTTGTVTAVPEPATWLLAIVAIPLVASKQRRRIKNSR